MKGILLLLVFLSLCCSCATEEFTVMENLRGISGGDPYIITLDGLAYNLQALGEFLMLQEASGNGITIQARLCPYYGAAKVSVMSVYCGLAISFSGVQLSITRSSGPSLPNIFVNGYYISDNSQLDMGDYGTIAFSGSVGYNDDPYVVSIYLTGLNRNITVTVLTGTPTATTLAEQFLSWRVHIPVNVTTIGFMGNNNGDPSDDLFLRDNSVQYSSLTYKQRYGEYYESYRITQEESAFYYLDGENTTTFTDRSFRGLYLSGAYSPDEIRYAQGLCGAYLLNGLLYDGCVSDIVVAGDPNLLYGYPDYTKIPGGAPTPFPTFRPVLQPTPAGSENGDVFVIVGGVLAAISLFCVLIFLIVLKKREKDLQKRGTWHTKNWEPDWDSEEELSDEEDGDYVQDNAVGSKTATA